MRPILIAEDERPIADLIELTLTGAGYACEQANDGGTAADLIADCLLYTSSWSGRLARMSRQSILMLGTAEYNALTEIKP